jgi:hypothetical protein
VRARPVDQNEALIDGRGPINQAATGVKLNAILFQCRAHEDVCQQLYKRLRRLVACKNWLMHYYTCTHPRPRPRHAYAHAHAHAHSLVCDLRVVIYRVCVWGRGWGEGHTSGSVHNHCLFTQLDREHGI